MNHSFKQLTKDAAAACLLPLFLVLAGCYTSGPNIDQGSRVRFPDEFPSDGPVGAGHPPVTGAQPSPGSGAEGATASVGDLITVSFSDVSHIHMPAQVQVRVGTDGTFTLPQTRVIRALGRTSTELERDIRNAYVPSLFVNLTAIVKFEDRYFFVGGEVRVPQRQIHTGGYITVLRAIETAGGYTEFASKKRIEVRRASGKTEKVNGVKAREDPALDLPVFPGDHIVVKRKIW